MLTGCNPASVFSDYDYRNPELDRGSVANDFSLPSDMGRDAEISDAHVDQGAMMNVDQGAMMNVDQGVMMNDAQMPVEDMSVPETPISDGGVDDATAEEENAVSDAQPSGDGR